jgi:Fe-S oxidoreductase
MSKRVSLKDFDKPGQQLIHLELDDLAPLPAPYDQVGDQPRLADLKEGASERYAASLDNFIGVSLPIPETEEEKQALVDKFISGMKKIISREDNWGFMQQLLLSLEHCERCQTCNDACPIYEASGNNPLYRPTYRSEIFRRLMNKYGKGQTLRAKLKGEDIELNFDSLSRLLELAYRCTLCRRCAQTCPIGVDNGLITHEIRKIFSQELGIAPKEIHEDGSVLQLKVGSSTGMNALVMKDNIDFIDEDMEDLTGIHVETPWDKEGADVLLIHNAGEILAWPENPGAFAIILEAAGISWTLSSELCAYDGINYGLWYDDVQLARVAVEHAKIAKKLGVKKIVIGECGHANKALAVIADRVLAGDLYVPRESAMTLLEDIVFSGKLKLDPSKNDFPVTMHDPCNLVRLMGVVEPQRRIIRKICPQFREMTPHGVDNYCCGGGSGFAIMNGHNFADFRNALSARKKFQQIIGAFEDCLEPEVPKYVCAPCSNCKGTIRDLISYYDAFEKSNILYGGLVELIVNAMEEVETPFIEWEWH